MGAAGLAHCFFEAAGKRWLPNDAGRERGCGASQRGHVPEGTTMTGFLAVVRAC